MNTKQLIIAAACIFGLLTTHPVLADTGSQNPTPITGMYGSEFFDLQSEAVGETFRIFVAKPAPMMPDTKYPVIYVLDGNGTFGMASDTQRMMAMGGEIPPAFVVSIGYAVEHGFGATLGKRYRDYTPTPGGELEQVAKAMFDPMDAVKPGGGPAFLEFLRKELKPAIEACYPADPDDATIAGASLGGLYPTWVLLNQPDTFQRYIIISPSIWWNKEEVWQWEEAYAAANKDLNATVFVTAGGLETTAILKESMPDMIKAFPNPEMRKAMEASIAAYDKHGWPRMAEITPLFADKLKSRNYTGLKIHCHNMPDETHMSVPPSAFSRGLRFVFGHWNPEE